MMVTVKATTLMIIRDGGNYANGDKDVGGDDGNRECDEEYKQKLSASILLP